MKKIKKYTWVYLVEILYVLICYFFLLSSVTNKLNYFLSFLPSILKGIFFLSPLFFVIFNWIFVLRLFKKIDEDTLLKITLLIKYSLIPFFIIGGFLVLGLTLVAFIPLPGLFVIGVFPPILIFMGWMILLGSAPFSLAYITKSYKKGEGNFISFVLLTISQFIFSLDVIVIMYLTFKAKKYKWITVIVLTLLILCFSLVISELMH